MASSDNFCSPCQARAAQGIMGRLAQALSPQPKVSLENQPPTNATVTEIPGDPNAKLEIDRMPRKTFSW